MHLTQFDFLICRQAGPDAPSELIGPCRVGAISCGGCLPSTRRTCLPTAPGWCGRRLMQRTGWLKEWPICSRPGLKPPVYGGMRDPT